VGEDRSATRRRVTVQEAADILGITVEAVRGRIKRNTIAHERTDEGVFVFVGADWTANRSVTGGDQSPDQSPDQRLIVARLENEVQFLREELARKDAILLSMSEAMKAINPPASPEPPESPETATEGTVEPTPSEPSEGPQRGTQRRPWFWWWAAWVLLLVLLAPAMWVVVNLF
jgi:hypothetical protein